MVDTVAHGQITVRGAREHNLRSIDVDLPKRQFTVVAGVSGSGKSSLVFATIAAESQRLINQTYSAFVQGFMPTPDQPDVDSLEGLTAVVAIDQERMGANARSTVGTATDVHAALRVLFSRIAEPHIGSAQAYSFNVPTVKASGAITIERGAAVATKAEYSVQGGMCPRCEGLGKISEIDLGQLFDDTKSLADGAITVPGYNVDGWYVQLFSESGFLDADKPIRDYSARERRDFLYKEPTKVKVAGANMTYEGLVPRITKAYLKKDPSALQAHIRAFVERAVTFGTCPDCEGTRLSEPARNSRIGGVSIADACTMQVTELADWLRTIDDASVAPVVTSLLATLEGFEAIGLGYLSMDRSAGSLSGGEAQRTTMVRHLGSALNDVTYVFDEPTAGLHPHDVARMIALLQQLRDKGNTVLVVEHDPTVISIADHVVEIGPGAGSHGGQVVFVGTVDDLRNAGTLTGAHLDARAQVKTQVRAPQGHVEVRGASAHNLHDVDIDVPLGVLVAVTGVAGSGKSSLIRESLPAFAELTYIDQSAIKGTRRSSPATYAGVLDPIRKAFAQATGAKASLFSANSEGGCPACKGAGVIETELGPFSTVTTTCEECEGTGFQAAVLELTLAGKNIVDVLALSVEDALQFFGDGEAHTPATVKVLDRLARVGLSYVRLGQPLTSLSGGERQRLKLAAQWSDRLGTLVLDEPTSGLHPADVTQLLGMLDALVDAGGSVIVIEHDLAVIAHADWVIDLGPGAGHDGGQVVFSGAPQDLVSCQESLTGQHLAAALV